MKKLAPLSIAIAAFGLMAIPSASAAIVIDDFSSGTNSVTNSGNGNVENRQGPLAGVLDNGYRNVVVRNFGANQGTGNSAEVNGGLFSGVRGPGPETSDFLLEYTGLEFPGTGGWNFTGLVGMTQMRIDLSSNTNAALQISIQVVKWDVDYSNYTLSSTVSAYAPVGASTLFVDLAPMNLDTFGGIDQLNIRFAYAPDPYVYDDTINQSFGISQITAIPEPGSLALVSLGALALMAHRRRTGSARV